MIGLLLLIISELSWICH